MNRRQMLGFLAMSPAILVLGPKDVSPTKRVGLTVLRVDQEITQEQAEQIRQAWQGAVESRKPIVLGPHITVEHYG